MRKKATRRTLEPWLLDAPNHKHWRCDQPSFTHHIHTVHWTQFEGLILSIQDHVDHGADLRRKYVSSRIKENTLLYILLERQDSSEIYDNPWWVPYEVLFASITYRWMQDSIISLAMSFNLWLRCEANSGSGQCRSLMNDWRASNFQNRSSEVAQPLLKK